MRVGQRDGGQGNITCVFNGIGIGNHVPNHSPGRDRGQLFHSHRRVAQGRNSDGHIICDHRIGVIGVGQTDICNICHPAAIHIRLQRIIRPSAIDEIAGLQPGRWQRIAEQGRDFVISQGSGAEEGHVTGISDDIGIGDGLPGSREIRQIGGFCDNNAWLFCRAVTDQLVRTSDQRRIWACGFRYCRGAVGDGPTIYIGLRHRIDKFATVIALAGRKPSDRASAGDQTVSDRGRQKRDIARVCDCDDVSDLLAHGRECAVRLSLCQ